MGYRKIANLELGHNVLLFKEVLSLEKVHGTSAHITFKDGQLKFFSGGEKHNNFIGLFDEKELLEKFVALGHTVVTVYGEAYGGRCQRMGDTYGHDPKFIAFEVCLTPPFGKEEWMPVERAEKIALSLGLEFVYYERGPATIEWLTEQRDAPSVQAVRNGMGEGKMREGVVIRPVEEFTDRWGGRILSKYKNPKFGEQKTPRSVDPEENKKRLAAKNIAEEFTVPMRLDHVLAALCADGTFADSDGVPTKKHIRFIIPAMQADIRAEEGHNFQWTEAIAKEVGTRTVKLFLAELERQLQEGV